MTANVPQKKTDTPKAAAPDPEGRMTFTAHLGELRTRMIRSLAAMLVGFIICLIFSENIIQALREPLTVLTPLHAPADPAAPAPENAPRPVDWMVTTPFEGFLVQLKISAYFGILLALPVIIFEICGFIFPGLKASERRIVRMMLGGGFTLAIAGVSVAYFAILRMALPGILEYVPEGVQVNLRLSETLSVILKVMLAFGMAFQMPMIVLVLVYVGLLTPAALKAYRKIMIVAIVIFAAVLTPPDPVSQLAMAIPLWFLYEFSILVSHVVVRNKAKAAAQAGQKD